MSSARAKLLGALFLAAVSSLYAADQSLCTTAQSCVVKTSPTGVTVCNRTTSSCPICLFVQADVVFCAEHGISGCENASSVLCLDAPSASTQPPTSPSTNNHVVGIVVGILCGLLVLILILVWMKHHRRAKEQREMRMSMSMSSVHSALSRSDFFDMPQDPRSSMGSSSVLMRHNNLSPNHSSIPPPQPPPQYDVNTIISGHSMVALPGHPLGPSTPGSPLRSLEEYVLNPPVHSVDAFDVTTNDFDQMLVLKSAAKPSSSAGRLSRGASGSIAGSRAPST
ncbi:hypothetical protein Ae201684P_019896 [Aphanomyces euteiches]|uniref:Membrane anchor Opy2 N-terminal domain-containing protein n=1 Tax=Aphanomyces euteiches TaxID=100861 RepID=A0A6G0WEJ6_9STRA|nr:hypothetical protein Ae201684_016639 [Aphanomyces euteiches]KAH9078826.1 hypothetical protein Ae201684P_019896 [Aphanomyces euteiches]